MKLSAIVETMLDEKSATAEMAEKMGLRYGGRGRWYDQNGKYVARTVGNQLVKVEDGDAPEGTLPAQQGAETPDDGDAVDEPDTDQEMEPTEPQEPVMSHGISRLLASANGDSMAVRKQLAKKYRAGDDATKAKIKKYIEELDAYDAREKEELQTAIQKAQAKKDAIVAARKAKYAAKYPSPQI